MNSWAAFSRKSKALRKAQTLSVSIKKLSPKKLSNNSLKTSSTTNPFLNTSTWLLLEVNQIVKSKDIDNAFTLANSSKTKSKESESCCIPMAESMKDNGKTTWKRVKVIKYFAIHRSTMVHTRKENLLAMVNMSGKMDKFIKDNGLMD